ncbi:MAG: hypothetical protein Q9204_006190 [Flavoplaca sp. TL-2023a]
MGNMVDERIPTHAIKLYLSRIRDAAAKAGLPLTLSAVFNVVSRFAGSFPGLRWLKTPGFWLTSISLPSAPYFTASIRQERELAVSSGEASNASSDNDTDQIADKILDLLTKYGQHDTGCSDTEGGHWAGRAEFSDRIRDQVNRRSPIKMVLPVLLWKSINNVDKVVGKLPDLGEVLALARLDQLCRDIETVYPRGDLVGIPEEHTWEYSEALAKIIEEKGFDRLNLRRVMDVIGFTDQEPITKQIHLSLTHRSREVLMQKYGKTEDDIKVLINTDHDTLMTYRGFIRFLETDFRNLISSGRLCGAHQIGSL